MVLLAFRNIMAVRPVPAEIARKGGGNYREVSELNQVLLRVSSLQTSMLRVLNPRD